MLSFVHSTLLSCHVVAIVLTCFFLQLRFVHYLHPTQPRAFLKWSFSAWSPAVNPTPSAITALAIIHPHSHTTQLPDQSENWHFWTGTFSTGLMNWAG